MLPSLEKVDYIARILDWMAVGFVLSLGFALAAVVLIFIIDITQRKDAIRHNYPVIGRLRPIFIRMGEFFRQYFFAMDREEMPFNRAQRQWVYYACRGESNTRAFGSTNNQTVPGTVVFMNCAFATMQKDATPTQPKIIGPHCEHPYEAKSILNISGMSYGALSAPAVRALSRGAKLAGCWMNTGEGGLAPYHLEGGCDIVFQMGTAKFGVRNPDSTLNEDRLREVAAHPEVKMIEIKLSQGAKPGKGGILPAVKVHEEIAEIRGIPAWQEALSPNRHPEIKTIYELLDFIKRVRDITGKPVGFKCVIGGHGWLEELCVEINKRGKEHAPDFITIDSGDGGTGAAPMPLMDNVGLLIRESLPLVVDILKKYGLKERVRVVASGKLITPAEVAWAICAGADFVNNARGFMFSLGCIQAMRCNKDTCPTGVTTHRKHLQKALVPEDKAVRVANYCKAVVSEVEIIAHSCGVTEPHKLSRLHVRIMQPDGRSLPLKSLHDEELPEAPDAGVTNVPSQH